MRFRSLRARIHRRSDYLWPFLALAVALIAIRAVLPYVVKDYVNKRLHAMGAYEGSVADIDMGLWRGAYRIDGIEIVKKGAGHSTPFFDSKRVDFSVEWHSLLHGKLVSEAHFYEPKLNLVESANEQQSQTGKEEDWHAKLEELFPFQFNTVAVHEGTITFRTPLIPLEDAIKAEHTNGEITNITNVVHKEKDNFADIDMKARVLDGARVAVSGSAEPFTENATFDVNLSLEKLQIVKLNTWLRQYIKADAKKGEIDLYLEMASDNGHYKGYAKPIVRELDFVNVEDVVKENPVKTLWKGTLQAASKVLRNQPEKQVAARIPFSGTTAGGKTEVLASAVSVLRNAFVQAFRHSIEGSISLKDVKQGEPSGDTDRG
jgi:hypothetical protein